MSNLIAATILVFSMIGYGILSCLFPLPMLVVTGVVMLVGAVIVIAIFMDLADENDQQLERLRNIQRDLDDSRQAGDGEREQ